MARRCTVCDHPERSDIDAALVGASMPLRQIAERYGLRSWTNAVRHAMSHIPTLLAESHQAEIEADASTLLEKVVQLEGMARVWHDEAVQLLADAKAGEEPARVATDDGGEVIIARKDPIGDRAKAITVGVRAVRTIGGVLEL